MTSNTSSIRLLESLGFLREGMLRHYRIARGVARDFYVYALLRDTEATMSRFLRFPTSVKRDPAIEVWMHGRSGELGRIARRWFEVMRQCGEDVRELLHDGHPTACIGDAAFAYVNVFRDHVNVGFFRGAELADPTGLLEGTGRFMRHVKLRRERDVDDTALTALIETAYTDMKGRLKEGEQGFDARV
jgi:hypothetical protein